MITLIFSWFAPSSNTHVARQCARSRTMDLVTQCHACACAQVERNIAERVARGHAALVAPIDPIDAKEEALAALLPNFLRRRAEDVKRIRDAVVASDFNAIATIGHNLRGNGASYGFPQLSAIGEAIERSASAKDREAILREVERLAEALEQIETSKLSAQPSLK